MLCVQLEASFDAEDAKKVLVWIQMATRANFAIEDGADRYRMMENFYKTLKDGRLLCM